MNDIYKMELITQLSKLIKIVKDDEYTIEELDDFDLGILELYANFFKK